MTIAELRKDAVRVPGWGEICIAAHYSDTELAVLFWALDEPACCTLPENGYVQVDATQSLDKEYWSGKFLELIGTSARMIGGLTALVSYYSGESFEIRFRLTNLHQKAIEDRGFEAWAKEVVVTAIVAAASRVAP